MSAAPYRTSGSRTSWRSFAWGALLETDGDLSGYDYMLVVGEQRTVELWENAAVGASFQTDSPETPRTPGRPRS